MDAILHVTISLLQFFQHNRPALCPPTFTPRQSEMKDSSAKQTQLTKYSYTDVILTLELLIPPMHGANLPIGPNSLCFPKNKISTVKQK